MKLLIAQSALQDLQDIQSYYLQQSVPAVGIKFIEDILLQAQRLLAHPDAGRKVPEFDQETIREIIFPPFRIVYLRNPAEIYLVRVWRSERMLVLPDNIT